METFGFFFFFFFMVREFYFSSGKSENLASEGIYFVLDIQCCVENCNYSGITAVKFVERAAVVKFRDLICEYVLALLVREKT